MAEDAARSLSVLIVEDSENDAILLVKELRRCGYEPFFLRVETAEDMKEALEDRTWDVIIADYCMPHFNGLAALKLVQERVLDLPFIVVSGTIGEDIAVQTMKAGAHDYVMKDNLRRLGPAIKREIVEAGVRRERKKTEALIRSILENVDEGFIVVDRDYWIASANRAYCELIGKTEAQVIGKRCYEAAHNLTRPCHEMGERCAVHETFETGNPSTAIRTYPCRGEEGSCVYVETKSFPLSDPSGRITSVIEVSNNITEKKKLEEQLLQSQKMEALGQFTGGIAHDFSNILTAIIGYASVLQMKMGRDNPLRATVDHILASTERASSLTRGLLAFSRKQIINPVPTDINETIRTVERLLVRIIGEDIELVTRLCSGPLTLMAGSGQIEQVLVNLATNARDAMPEGGMLTIETDRIEIEDGYGKADSDDRTGTYAVISVADAGVGMDEKMVEKIFEPFFTTKEPGKGTGLGLSIVYGIVNQNNGFVDVISEPGRGTTFRIHFPLIRSETDQADLPGLEAARSFSLSGSETVLVAEDDGDVRALTRSVLEQFGYRVIEAVDGQEAVEKFIENRDDVDLAILDVVMPKKNGREVLTEIERLRPDMKAIFTSGYTADLIHKKGILDTGLEFILKPVSPAALLTKVRNVLDGKKTTR